MSTIALERLQYPIEEGAALLGVSKHTLIRDIRLGRVKTSRYGKRVLIPRDEILRIAAEGMRTAALENSQSGKGITA
jgi:excisionase family DNA binding protein